MPFLLHREYLLENYSKSLTTKPWMIFVESTPQISFKLFLNYKNTVKKNPNYCRRSLMPTSMTSTLVHTASGITDNIQCIPLAITLLYHPTNVLACRCWGKTEKYITP